MSHINPYKAWAGSFVPNWLLERTEVSAAAKLLYARLCQFKGKGDRCNPKLGTMARTTGMKLSMIRRAKAELEQIGLLDTVQLGNNKANHYLFPEHEWMRNLRTPDCAPVSSPECAPVRTPYIEDIKIVPPTLRESDENNAAKPPKGSYAVVVAHWFASYERQYGVKPPMDSRRGKAIKSLMASCKNDAAEVCRLMDAYLDDADSFVANQKHPVHLIQMRMERYAATKQQVIRWTPSKITNYSER